MPWKNPQSKQEQIRLSILRRYPSQLLLCVLLCPLAISGKLCFAQTAVPLKNAVVSTWTTDQGLPQNFISSLAQTPDGFIWVGTLTGLARFDGVSFRGFSKDGPVDNPFIKGLTVARNFYAPAENQNTANGPMCIEDQKQALM